MTGTHPRDIRLLHPSCLSLHVLVVIGMVLGKAVRAHLSGWHNYYNAHTYVLATDLLFK